MKNKKGFNFLANKQFLIIALILLGVFIYFGFMKTASIVNDKKEVFSFDYQGIIFDGQTAILGSLTESSSQVVCSGGTGTSSYSNSYDVGETITLSSSMSVPNTASCGGNYIWVKGNVPAGDIEVSCSTSAYFKNRKSGTSVGKCEVLINGINKFTSSSSATGDIYDVSDSKTENFETSVNKDSELWIRLKTDASSYGGSSSAKATISFKKEITEEQATEEPLPSSNQEPEQEQVTQELSFLDKINLWFQSWIDRILGWFK